MRFLSIWSTYNRSWMSCKSRRRSCNHSAQVLRRSMFSHSEVLRDVARTIVRGYDQLYDQKHDIWQSFVHDWWYNHESLMVRPICDWWYDLFASQNRRWEVLNMFKNLAGPSLLLRSSTTSKASRALFLRFKYYSQNFGLYIGCNWAISLVWLKP